MYVNYMYDLITILQLDIQIWLIVSVTFLIVLKSAEVIYGLFFLNRFERYMRAVGQL